MNKRLKSIIRIAVMSALISALSPLSIPIGVVPISLSTFIIMISVFVLNPVEALISVLIYIILGSLGLPVFSNFSGGLSKLIGPTGGYIIGYLFIPLTFIIINKRDNIFFNTLGILIGNIFLYALGTIWLKYSLGITFIEALMMGVVPFLITDLIKIILAISIGMVLYKIFNNTKDNELKKGA